MNEKANQKVLKMSEFVPSSEENQFDENLLRSIETLLDDNEHNLFASEINVNSFNSNIEQKPEIPFPPYQQLNDDSFAFGNQIYRKWSNNESNEIQNVGNKPRNNFQKSKEYHGKPFKKNTTANMVPPLQQLNPHVLRYQAMLVEKANRILHQYLQLNYEFLSAQAAVLGIPLDQYIRNLLMATANQSVLMPFQLQQGIPNLMPQSPIFPMQNVFQPRQFNKMPSNKKN